MSKLIIKVYKDGRVALPKKILKKYTLSDNDFILVEELPDGIKLIPARIQPIKEFRTND